MHVDEAGKLARSDLLLGGDMRAAEIFERLCRAKFAAP